MLIQVILILGSVILIIAILEWDKIKQPLISLIGRTKQVGIINKLAKHVRQQTATSRWNLEMPDVRVPLKILKLSGDRPKDDDIKRLKEIIEKILHNFNIKIQTMNEPLVGPTVTIYSFKLAVGVKAQEILAIKKDLASVLSIHPIKIEAPIPGTDLIGIEVPNKIRANVSLRDELETREFKDRTGALVVPFGRDMKYKQWNVNLHDLPHLLIGGAASSGKSAFINSLIIGLMTKNSPSSLRFILADPKRVELPRFNNLPYLLTPVITGCQKAINALNWCLSELDLRLKTFAAAEIRNLEEYNKERKEKLPYIVFVIDEICDFGVGGEKKALEEKMIKLLQLGRAAGIHLVVASSRPGDEAFSALLKANFPARLCFAVAARDDSLAILNTSGAEKLLGKGDALFINAEMIEPVRLQVAHIDTETISQAIKYIREKSENIKPADLIDLASAGDNLDELIEEAKSLIIEKGHASISLLQRKLNIEYARASYMLDQLENFGIIGPANGSNPREVFVTPEMYKKMKKRAALENANPGLVDDLLEAAKELVMKSGQASAAYLERKLNIGYARSARLLSLMEEQGIIGPGVGALPRKVIKNENKIILPQESSSAGAMAKKINIKILHFEDEEFLSQMYGAKFQKEGFDYKCYNSPSKNPVEIVLKEKPDLILMDIIMPVMDGFTATEILKSHPETKSIPIFGLCNFSQKEDETRGLNLGMADYFIKQHFIPSEVVLKIKAYLKEPKNYKAAANRAGLAEDFRK